MLRYVHRTMKVSILICHRITATWSVWLENYSRFWEPGYPWLLSGSYQLWTFVSLPGSSWALAFQEDAVLILPKPTKFSSQTFGALWHSTKKFLNNPRGFGTVDEYILVANYRQPICFVLIFCSVSSCTCSIKNSSSYDWETCTSYQKECSRTVKHDWSVEQA